MKRSILIICIFAFICLLLPFQLSPADSFKAKVVSIIDGDTINIQKGNETITVRLNGIDCPELNQECGERAKQFVYALTFSEIVEIVPHGKDKYGRLLADVILSDSRSLNLEIVKDGFAWWYRKYSKDPVLQNAETKAKLLKRGIWGKENPTPPWEFRHSTYTTPPKNIYNSAIPSTPNKISKPNKIKNETIVYVTKTGRKYHRGSCGYLRRSKIPISLNDAKSRGYTPCSRCNPPK